MNNNFTLKINNIVINIYIGEARLGTDESVFNAILCTRSWTHLRQIMIQYQLMYGHSLEKAVTREFSANAEKILLGIRIMSHFLI